MKNQRDHEKAVFGSFRSPQGWLFLFGFLAVVSASGYFAFSHRSSHEGKPLAGKTDFGQFPPYTPAERELAKMLAGKDQDIDLALANWLIVADIPQFAGMKREDYSSQLDVICELVRKDMASRWKVALSKGKSLADPQTRCSIFCGSIIKLGFNYAAEFAQHALTREQAIRLHSNAQYLFLAGLVAGQRGTCASMPMIYAVLAQRFGFPVHLVSIGQHCFVRWEERGFRANIETTMVDHVYTTDDDFYIEDEGKTRATLRGSELRNLTNREVVAELFLMRWGHFSLSQATRCRSWMDISRAFHLAPETPNIEGAYKEVWNHYHFTPQDTMLTLQQKQLNMIAEQIAVEHLAAEAAAANVPPPRLAMPQSSLTQPQQVGISQPAPQNIQQIQQLQTQQALQGSR